MLGKVVLGLKTELYLFPAWAKSISGPTTRTLQQGSVGPKRHNVCLRQASVGKIIGNATLTQEIEKGNIGGKGVRAETRRAHRHRKLRNPNLRRFRTHVQTTRPPRPRHALATFILFPLRRLHLNESLPNSLRISCPVHGKPARGSDSSTCALQSPTLSLSS